MPSLRMFGRDWKVAVDDLAVYAGVAGLWHVVWVIVEIVFLARATAESDQPCIDSEIHLFTWYMSVDIVCFLLYALLLFYTLRGSILDVGARKPAIYILYGISAIYTFLLVINIAASVLKNQFVAPCQDAHRERLALAIFICHWIFWGVWALAALLAFDPFATTSVEQRYAARLWLLKCCSAGASEARPGAAEHIGEICDRAYSTQDEKMESSTPMSQIGALMTLVFTGVDMTTTDYATALILVRNAQRMDREDALAAGVGKPEVAPIPLDMLEDAAHYLPHALSIYGWASNVLNKQDIAAWGCGASCVAPCTGKDVHVGDNMLFSSKNMTIQGVKVMTKSNPETDLLYMSWDNEIQGLLPYYICIDRPRREVIISVRGSLSAADWMTDLLVLPVEVDANFLGCDPSSMVAPEDVKIETTASRRRLISAHKGMLGCAKTIAADLRRHKVLDAVLKSDQHAREALKHDIYKQDCSDHQLVVVGHSLGAGVAALLALHLRSVYPGTRCWAYAPPGGLMSPELSAAMRDYCTSVVCGRDLVPRLSLSNMEILARQMIECSARCKQPKVRVILHPGKKWKRDDLFKPEAEMSADARKTLEAYMRNSGSSHCAGGKVIEARDFLTPGKLLYYEANDSDIADALVFTPQFVDNKEFAKNGMLISTFAVDMHMPWMYQMAVDKALDDAHRGLPSTRVEVAKLEGTCYAPEAAAQTTQQAETDIEAAGGRPS
uniref:sn-1-specific diacylglycerol lipase n=1 Tax=Chlamydomonas euryale TaxID=1486919 RepID=A0A7R9YQW8_9CHLO